MNAEKTLSELQKQLDKDIEFFVKKITHHTNLRNIVLTRKFEGMLAEATLIDQWITNNYTNQIPLGKTHLEKLRNIET